MIRTLSLTMILTATALSTAGIAFAAPSCTDKAKSEWIPEDQMRAEVAKLGYSKIKVFQVSGSCYEIYALTKDGARAEVYFNPVDGSIVQNNVD